MNREYGGSKFKENDLFIMNHYGFIDEKWMAEIHIGNEWTRSIT